MYSSFNHFCQLLNPNGKISSFVDAASFWGVFMRMPIELHCGVFMLVMTYVTVLSVQGQAL